VHTLLLLIACGSTPVPRDPALPTADGPDADGDGLSDAREAALGTRPDARDSDGDGKGDGEEVLRWRTDPLKIDTDGDGAPDGYELSTRKTDPLVPDGPEAAPPADVSGRPTAAKASRRRGADAPAPSEADRCQPGAPPTFCWVQIPAGTVRMGAQATDPAAPGYDPAASPDEAPVHSVSLPAYWITVQEISASMFGRCVEDGACDPAQVSDQGGYSTWKRLEEERKVAVPITGITWEGAQRLCWWLGGRLPTEAEWERAARGDGERRWPWGDTPGCGVSRFATGPPPDPSMDRLEMMQGPCVLQGPLNTDEPIGPSPFGLVGMAGNVWEWVADWYAPDAYARHSTNNPTGPETGTERVQRGGGWMQTDPLELRAAGRAHMPPDMKLNDVGVRCVWGDAAASGR
jgi:formylglycine-generating enzyme required for sulfatase activity